MRFKLALLATLALAGANAMACYTLYDRNNRVIYQGMASPVDLSMQLHEALRRYPGAHLVFDQAAACARIELAQVARPAVGDVPRNTIRRERAAGSQSRSTAPLITTRETAQLNHLPHTAVSGNVVVVPPKAAARVDLPTFNVIPASVPAASADGAPDTRVLGAGPARPAPAGGAVVISPGNRILPDGRVVRQN